MKKARVTKNKILNPIGLEEKMSKKKPPIKALPTPIPKLSLGVKKIIKITASRIKLGLQPTHHPLDILK